MITEDYVSFETAKLLKEKCFDENTHMWWYTVYGELGEYDVTDRGRRPELYINAPTLQMAMKWLREEHNIHIAINICYTENPKLFHPDYYAYVNSTVTGESLIKEMCPLVQDNSLTPKGFTSYEQACEAAIKYCLENLI